MVGVRLDLHAAYRFGESEPAEHLIRRFFPDAQDLVPVDGGWLFSVAPESIAPELPKYFEPCAARVTYLRRSG